MQVLPTSIIQNCPAVIEKIEWSTWQCDPTAAFTCLITIFTAGLAIFAYLQFRITRKTAERQLRAYISSQPNYVHNFTSTIPCTINYTIANIGETPAHQVSHIAVVDILPYPLPQHYVFPNLPTLPNSTYTLHPNDKMNGIKTADRLFSAQEIANAVNNNGYRIYIFGVVRYIDIFGKTRKTKFCRSVIGSQNLASVGSNLITGNVEIAYEIAALHNEAN